MSFAGSLAVANIIHRETNYSILKDESRLGKLYHAVTDRLPRSLRTVMGDPGPSWLVSDFFLGIRNLSTETFRQTRVASAALAVSGVVTAAGLAVVCAQSLFRKNIPKGVATYLSAAQGGCFTLLNLYAGQYRQSVCLALWAFTSFLIARSMVRLEKEKPS